MCLPGIFPGGNDDPPAPPPPTIILPAQPAAPVIPAPIEDPNADAAAAEAASAAIRKAKRQRATADAIQTGPLGVDAAAPAAAKKLLGM